MQMGGGKKGPEDAEAGGGGAGRTEAGVGRVHMAHADHAKEEEADAAELVVAEWARKGVLGQGTKEIQELIKQLNEVKDAVAWNPRRLKSASCQYVCQYACEKVL